MGAPEHCEENMKESKQREKRASSLSLGDERLGKKTKLIVPNDEAFCALGPSEYYLRI